MVIFSDILPFFPSKIQLRANQSSVCFLIYRDLLHGNDGAQWPSLTPARVLPGNLHRADYRSDVYLATHANGDLSLNGAKARAGVAGLGRTKEPGGARCDD